jgi:hypothetical protein
VPVIKSRPGEALMMGQLGTADGTGARSPGASVGMRTPIAF